ncbi:MAG TPA: methyltransferase domain-containing protein [Candidatus Polarisedimenticolia bacterium]|nr:methyltransferase domain-containing protein [Candidatus Polarisedimenticolia bacterium]
MRLDELYHRRFKDTNQSMRRAMWEVLCRVVLQRYFEPSNTVVDLGAGFCEFINNIRCTRKIAVDGNPAVREHAAADVHIVLGDIPAVLTQLGDGCADAVFCSNFLEHLRDKETVLVVLGHVRRILKVGGRLVVIQPNIRYAYKEYWDFFDHHVALSHGSMREALEMTGFHIDVVRPRFLPFTTRSRLPQAAWLVRLYLACLPAQWLLGKQMLVVARKTT